KGLEFDGYGIAVAGRYALTERLGFALRGEWVDLDFAGASSDLEVWGITGTFDYRLIDGLKLRAELRYDDSGSSDVDDRFFDDQGAKIGIATRENQLVGGVEVIYSY
ncbi:MAG: outer membrane beta-barrel protein, partial [Myxococcota bacterium]